MGTASGKVGQGLDNTDFVQMRGFDKPNCNTVYWGESHDRFLRSDVLRRCDVRDSGQMARNDRDQQATGTPESYRKHLKRNRRRPHLENAHGCAGCGAWDLAIFLDWLNWLVLGCWMLRWYFADALDFRSKMHLRCIGKNKKISKNDGSVEADQTEAHMSARGGKAGTDGHLVLVGSDVCAGTIRTEAGNSGRGGKGALSETQHRQILTDSTANCPGGTASQSILDNLRCAMNSSACTRYLWSILPSTFRYFVASCTCHHSGLEVRNSNTALVDGPSANPPPLASWAAFLVQAGNLAPLRGVWPATPASWAAFLVQAGNPAQPCGVWPAPPVSWATFLVQAGNPLCWVWPVVHYSCPNGKTSDTGSHRQHSGGDRRVRGKHGINVCGNNAWTNGGRKGKGKAATIRGLTSLWRLVLVAALLPLAAAGSATPRTPYAISIAEALGIWEPVLGSCSTRPGTFKTSHEDFQLKIETVNATTWTSAIKYLRDTDAHVVCVQEHKLAEGRINEANAQANASGWRAVWSPATTTPKGAQSGGVAICVRQGIGLVKTNTASEQQHRLVAASVEIPGVPPLLILSAYFSTGGGMIGKNLALLKEGCRVVGKCKCQVFGRRTSTRKLRWSSKLRY